MFDVTAGADLTQRHDCKLLFTYIKEHKPLVVMGPPCTTFSHWSHVNKIYYPDSYAHQRAIGTALAKVAAKVAQIQANGGRYFVLEQPAGSKMFSLPCMRTLLHNGDIDNVTFPQCALGLVIDGAPILKRTAICTRSV